MEAATLHCSDTFISVKRNRQFVFLASSKPFLLSLHASSESLGEKSQFVDKSGFQFLMKMQKGASKQAVALSGSEKGSILTRKL